jgi:hypothetical protein
MGDITPDGAAENAQRELVMQRQKLSDVTGALFRGIQTRVPSFVP